MYFMSPAAVDVFLAMYSTFWSVLTLTEMACLHKTKHFSIKHLLGFVTGSCDAKHCDMPGSPTIHSGSITPWAENPNGKNKNIVFH